MNDQEVSLKADDDTPRPICPRCFNVMHGNGLFCNNCGPKVSSLDPYAHIAKLGDTYREASTNPRNLIMLIGMWVWLGPIAIILVALFAYGIVNIREVIASVRNGNDMFALLVFVGLFGGLTLGAITLLYRTTRNYLKLRNERA